VSCPRGVALSEVKFLGEMSSFSHSRAILLLIPPTPFSHNGRRGSPGVVMPETGDGTQGFPKKPASVSNPLLPQGEGGSLGVLLIW